MSDYFGELHDAVTGPANGGRRKARPTLPAPLPPDGTRAQACEWLTEALSVQHDPVAGASRWGRHPTSPAEITLSSGRVVKFDEARDITRPQVLATTVRSFTDGKGATPTYTGAEAQEVYAVVCRLCGVIAEDESAQQAHDWMGMFLSRHVVKTGTLTTPEEKWRALSELRSARYDPSVIMGDGVNEPVVLADTVSGLRYVRAADVAVFVRRRLGVTISWPRLRGEMLRAGYEFRELQQWRPGAERKGPGTNVKVHAYVLPPDEDACNPVTPGTPGNTRAPARAHTPSEGVTPHYGVTSGDAGLGWDVLDSFPDGASIALAEYEARAAQMRVAA